MKTHACRLVELERDALARPREGGHDVGVTPRARHSVTILHLSDPQFGPNQREVKGATTADRQHGTLQARLLQDMEEIVSRHDVPRPDLVMVTGDLTEHAKPSQFTAFEAFAAALVAALELPRERLVMVPGNHDVSWSGCQAYFNACEAAEREPEPPYWPKWASYADLFGRWYGAGSPMQFTDARPYSLFVYEELCTVVAGLNSTMLETHRPGEHYGTAGEDQLRWFRDELAGFRRRGWLRIAAVHHNVQRNAIDDDANLKDAEYLEWLLADELNLVLHGHTHDGKLGWLRRDIPISSTGSTAVVSGARPHGVPCQYQVVSVHADRLKRWTRAYDERHDRFIADVTASRGGDEWRHSDPVSFVDLGTLSPSEPPERDVLVTATSAEQRRSGAQPTHTAIVLDRTHAWEALTTTMVATPKHAVFLVYGTWHQDVELFMTRITTYFNEQAASKHTIKKADPEHDGSAASTAEDWKNAATKATESRLSDLATALFDEAFSQPLLLVLSSSGPIRAATAKERDALVEFLVGLLPAALAARPPKHEIRVVVPIELPDDGSTDLVTRIHRGLEGRPNLTLIDHALTLPLWPDIEKSLRVHARHNGVALSNEGFDRCKQRFEALMASSKPSEQRMLDLGNGLHDLYRELLHAAKLDRAAPRS